MLEDIRLKKYTFENMPLLRKLKDENLKREAHVCIERAKYVTEYLKKKSHENDSMEIKYAKAVNYFLSQKEALFFDDNLIAGTTTSKFFGAPVYPELTGMTIWPELDTISSRKQNPQKLSNEEKNALNFEIFPYWMDKNILEYTRSKHNDPECMKLFQQFVFFIAAKSGCISHTIPSYELTLEKGVEDIIAQAKEAELRNSSSDEEDSKRKVKFCQAVQISMKGIIEYSKKLAEKARKSAKEQPHKKEYYLKIADVCERVPSKGSRTFREAVNAVWLVQVGIHAENINMAISPGRLDQVLYPYYKNDIENGTLTVKEAIELIGCLWFKLTDNTNLVPETAEQLFGGAGTVPAVTIGGISKSGEDAVNDLTYIMLRVTELLRTRDPSMNARFHYKKNTKEYRNRVSEVIVNTEAVPAFHNDVVDIEVLKKQGLKEKDANNYAIIGCVELGVGGKSYNSSSSIMFNLVSALELALYNGKRPITGNKQIGPETGEPDSFGSFEEFWEALKIQLRWLIGQAIELNEYFGKVHQEILPTPLLSSFFEDTIKTGNDLIFGGAFYNSSGATHIGFADTVDSLSAIEKAVFVSKKYTFSEVVEAIRVDFKGHEKLHAYLVNKTPKYGNDSPIARKNSQNLVGFLYDFYQQHTNYRGGKYWPAYWTMTNHAGQGKLTGALPNGRKEGKVFASGITPVSQAAKDLLTCLTEVGGLKNACIPGGEAFNLKYPKVDVENKQDIETFGDMVESYFKAGGLHIQFNIMSYEKLLDAKQNPENYNDLLVRVSGYSAYFNDLNEAMKDEIITRTAYDLKRKKAANYPKEYDSMLYYKGE